MERLNKYISKSVELIYKNEKYTIISCENLFDIELFIRENSVNRTKEGFFDCLFQFLINDGNVILKSLKFTGNPLNNNLFGKQLKRKDVYYYLDNIDIICDNCKLVFSNERNIKNTRMPFFYPYDFKNNFYFNGNEVFNITLIIDDLININFQSLYSKNDIMTFEKQYLSIINGYGYSFDFSEILSFEELYDFVNTNTFI